MISTVFFVVLQLAHVEARYPELAHLHKPVYVDHVVLNHHETAQWECGWVY